MKKNKKIFIVLIVIFIFYLVVITKLIQSENRRNENIKDNTLYHMYMLKNDKEKYDKLTRDDLFKIDVKNISKLSNENDVTEIVDENFDIKDSLIIFDNDQDKEFLSNEYYLNENITKDKILNKEFLQTYDEIIKDKILNYSFKGFISYEIPYVKKIENNLNEEIVINKDTNYMKKDSYKEILNNFIIKDDIDVNIFSQNKDTLEINLILKSVKLVYINEEKAVVCLMPNEANILKDNMDKNNILISQDELLDTEVYIFE